MANPPFDGRLGFADGRLIGLTERRHRSDLIQRIDHGLLTAGSPNWDRSRRGRQMAPLIGRQLVVPSSGHRDWRMGGGGGGSAGGGGGGGRGGSFYCSSTCNH